jgi:hypothetical protein
MSRNYAHLYIIHHLDNLSSHVPHISDLLQDLKDPILYCQLLLGWLKSDEGELCLTRLRHQRLDFKRPLRDVAISGLFIGTDCWHLSFFSGHFLRGLFEILRCYAQLFLNFLIKILGV